MTIGVANFYGKRLTEARLSRGLFMKTLGDMVGLSGAAIGRYEAGLDKPQADKLDTISKVLGFQQHFFLSSPWPEDLQPVFWRSRSSESKSAREMTEQRMFWLCEIFEFLESHLDFPDVALPKLKLPTDFRLITQETIEVAAESVRADWGIGRAPIPDMFLALENIGVPVSTLDIQSEKQDGFCFFSNALDRPFVGININGVSACRARFDAAHELGHLVLHANVKPEQERDAASKKLIESQAHRFASALLFPREAFLSKVNHISLDYFCGLKREWGVSIAAMVKRASDLELIDADTYMSLFQNMNRRRWRGRMREPYDDPRDMPLEQPRMLRRSAQVIVDAGLFGSRAFLAALPHPQKEIQSLLGLNDNFFSESKVVRLPTAKPVQNELDAIDLESGNVIAFTRTAKSDFRY